MNAYAPIAEVRAIVQAAFEEGCSTRVIGRTCLNCPRHVDTYDCPEWLDSVAKARIDKLEGEVRG